MTKVAKEIPKKITKMTRLLLQKTTEIRLSMRKKRQTMKKGQKA